MSAVLAVRSSDSDETEQFTAIVLIRNCNSPFYRTAGLKGGLTGEADGVLSELCSTLNRLTNIDSVPNGSLCVRLIPLI